MTLAGTDPGISTLSNGQIQITAKAQFSDSCCMVGPRTYMHVHENAVEVNRPIYCCLYPNCICNDFDRTSKVYFDRGIWDMRSCLYAIGWFSGPATFYSHNPKYVCLCMDCPSCMNDYYACHCAGCCGDRLYYTPFDSCCCGLCPSRATWCTNCCGLCGPKTGEPTVFLVFMTGLLQGSGESLSASINNARATWSARTLKP